jgi:16S rRNA (uracil1498-N3)-methyltransferase
VNPALRRSAAHVFVESIEHPVLADDDEHHLRRVLRLRDGETVSACDGAGAWRICRLDAAGDLVVDGDVVREVEPDVSISIGFAIPKGDRPEWIVQKLTEIGVDRILLVHSERSIVRWDASKVDRQLDRLGRVAREASMQSRRVRLPEIVGPFAVAALAGLGGPLAFADPDGDPPSLATPTIVIGPEGGWSPSELDVAQEVVSLGGTILRVETAAIVAASRLAELRERSITG